MARHLSTGSAGSPGAPPPADGASGRGGPARETDATQYVERFGRPTRVLHWTLAAPFLLLLLTGLTNFVPSLKATQVADVRLFAWLHVVLGIATLAAIPLVVLPLLLRRSPREDLRELSCVDVTDYLWLQHQALRATGAPSRPPPVRKFNAGQKLNALASAAATVALLGTGAVLGVNYVSKRVLDFEFVEAVFPWHTALSLLVIPLIAGHLYLTLIHPSTRESLRGITLGVVRRDWAARHHDAWRPPDRERHERR